MTDDIAIKVENLSKCYQIYDRPSDRLKQFLFRSRRQYYREFWAVKDVSFEIKKGETVGIVGRNGSGKSTLLQMICGTLNPTMGSVQTKGRVAALLELGSGFNPEFTGRENVYMNGAVLGLTQTEINERFDKILAFSEIGDFIEQPLKTYSSGMVMRLAFSVAINTNPDILVVDEALSVGDERFQRKCYSHMEALRNLGATIIFVSHSSSSVIELCERAMLMDAAQLLATGQPKQIIGLYQKLLYAPPEKISKIKDDIIKGSFNSAKSLDEKSILEPYEIRISPFYDPTLKPTSTVSYESEGALIENPIIFDINGKPVNNLVRGGIYQYRYLVKFSKAANNVRFGMMFKTLSGVELGGAVSSPNSRAESLVVKKGSIYSVQFEFLCRLNPGCYFFNAGVVGDLAGEETYLHRIIDAGMFRVIPEESICATGPIDFSCVASIKLR